MQIFVKIYIYQQCFSYDKCLRKEKYIVLL